MSVERQSDESSERHREGRSGPIRRSIEVEYWVVDDQGELSEPESLLDTCSGVEAEFTVPLIEIKTPPCESHERLCEELWTRLEQVVTRAEQSGKALVPPVTPLVDVPIEDRPSERTQIQDRVLGEQFEYVRRCAGTHIHVEQQPGATADQYNTMVALDPALGLVNSASHAGGEQIAAGARSKLYRWLAYECLPWQGTLWPYLDDKDEYAHRVQRRYEEFVTEAVLSGFDREFVESAFEPEGAVWTPVQLRQEFSTVEWRSPDTALPSQVLRLAGSFVSAVERAVKGTLQIGGQQGAVSDSRVVLPEFRQVQTHVRTAVDQGVTDSVRSYLDRMGFKPDAYTPLTRDIPASQKLTPEQARNLRLEYANRLNDDIKAGGPVVAD